MNEFNNFSGIIAGRIGPTPINPPATFEEVFLRASLEHNREHQNDGMSLFVFGAFRSTEVKWYLYPISTINSQFAFDIARELHSRRGLPSSVEWHLLFAPGKAGQGDVSVQ